MSFMSFYLDILTDYFWTVRCLEKLLALQGKGAQSWKPWMTRLQVPCYLSDVSISSLSCLSLFPSARTQVSCASAASLCSHMQLQLEEEAMWL